MASILTSAFPTSLTVDGEDYPINWGHRDCLDIMVELEKGDLTPLEQTVFVVQKLFVEIPDDFVQAVEQA